MKMQNILYLFFSTNQEYIYISRGFFHDYRYIESKPKYWSPKHSIIVKEIENMDKLKMALSVQHTINHQNYGDRNIRITELFLELKKIFENLNIKYHLLPQEIHLTQLNMSY